MGELNRKHRRLVQKHFAAAGTRSQVLRALALLVESGSVYCVIMVRPALPALVKVHATSRSRRDSRTTRTTQTFLIIYEIDVVPLHASAGVGFYRVAGYITRGCVIPLVVRGSDLPSAFRAVIISAHTHTHTDRVSVGHLPGRHHRPRRAQKVPNRVWGIVAGRSLARPRRLRFGFGWGLGFQSSAGGRRRCLRAW